MLGKKMKRLVKKTLWKISPSLVLRLLPASKNQFSVGIYTGQTPFDLQPARNVRNPVLTRADILDAPAGTVADPFMIRVERDWFMFFEILNQFNGKGEIAVATSKNALDWKYLQIVLAEPFHMSYPQIFSWQSEYFMIPETGRNGSVGLYRALNFPFDWVMVNTLIESARIVDSSILRYRDMWWLFADTGADSRNPTLRLYFAQELEGPWTEHPKSPLAVDNAMAARPGGRVVLINDIPHRFAQNVYPVYGTEVYAFEIYDLSVENYAERQVVDGPILRAGEDGWNRHGMHHIDLHSVEDGSWLACVDGCVRRELDET